MKSQKFAVLPACMRYVLVVRHTWIQHASTDTPTALRLLMPGPRSGSMPLSPRLHSSCPPSISRNFLFHLIESLRLLVCLSKDAVVTKQEGAAFFYFLQRWSPTLSPHFLLRSTVSKQRTILEAFYDVQFVDFKTFL